MSRRTDAPGDLLFGLLALQTGLITQTALVAAFHAWTLARDRPMSEILVEQAALDADGRALLEALTAKHLKMHGGDPEKSLAALGAGPSTRERLAGIGDPELDASLARIGPSQSDDDDPMRTLSFRPGSATSAGLRFRVVRNHAKGGLGEVFVAVDAEFNREVALKEIQLTHAHDPVSRERFVREAEITGNLEHPGIVPVYGLGTYADGRPFYAMRFIKGDSLKEAIAAFHADDCLKHDPGARSLELRKLLRRFLDVCNAIEYAHQRGVLHRDLKPGNIMVGRYGETLVVDWGLARARGAADRGTATDERTLIPPSGSGSAETLPGSALGTPGYMSPEQAAGDLDRLGPRSDVYSLGATLYSLLTGKPPFAGRDFGAILRAVQKGEFPRPREVEPAVDAALEAVCLKAMALKPEDRYGSPRALADDVERWSADEPVTAHQEPLRDRLARWGRRHRTLVAVAVVLLTVLALGSVPLTVLNRQKARALTQVGLARRTEKEQRKRADAGHYLASVALANRELAANNYDRADRLLDECPPDLRRAEWFYLKRQCRQDLLTFRGHGASVCAVAYSPDGRRIASGGDEGTVLIWDAETGAIRLALRGHTDRIMRLAYSPDGTHLASASLDTTVKVWDVATGREKRTLRGHTGGVSGVAFRPDGLQLASASWDHTVKVWDAATGRQLLTFRGHGGWLCSLDYSPDGLQIVSSCGNDREAFKSGTIKIWEAASGREVHSLVDPAGGEPGEVAFTSDGRQIVFGSFRSLAYWDVATGLESRREEVKASHLAIAPGERSLATAGGHMFVPGMSVAELAGPRNQLRVGAVAGESGEIFLNGHSDWVTGLSFRHDGRRLATASLDTTVKVWDVTAPRSNVVLGVAPSPATEMVFSGDGRRIATYAGGQVRVSEATTGRVLLTVRGRGGLALNSDGTRLVAVSPRSDPNAKDIPGLVWDKDTLARVWDVATGRQVCSLPVDAGPASFDPAGRRIIGRIAPPGAGRPGGVGVWNAETGGVMLSLAVQGGDAFLPVFSPDGRLMATGVASNRYGNDVGGEHHYVAMVWDAADGRMLRELRGHTNHVYGVAFSADSRRIATASQDSTIKIWDVASGRELATLRGHTATVGRTMFSANGTRLASLGLDERIKVWDLAAGRELFSARNLTTHIGRDVGIAFTPDGTRVGATYAEAGSITTQGAAVGFKVWDVATGQELLDLRGPTKAPGAAGETPDCRRIALAGQDRTVVIHDLSPTLLASGGAAHEDSGKRAEAPTPRQLSWPRARTLWGHEGAVHDVACAPDGTRIASVGDDRTVRVWDATTGRNLHTLRGHTNSVWRVAFSADGTHLASGGADKTVRVWDVATGLGLRTFTGHSREVAGVAFSPDGTRVASGDFTGVVIVWDRDTGRVIHTLKGHTAPASRLKFSPDGRRIASASQDRTVRIWDHESGEAVYTLKGHENSVASVTFSPDGRWLASASWDGTVKVWDPATGREVRTLRGHGSGVLGVAFSPESRRLASSGVDWTVKVWNVETWQVMRTLRGHTGTVNGVDFGPPGGKYLASASADGTVEVWDAPPPSGASGGNSAPNQ